MGALTTPNVAYPLAASYDPRGIAGDTNTKAGLDQRKINSMYEVTQNSVSGKSTLFLTKRPGFNQVDSLNFGVSTQISYLATLAPGQFINDVTASWVYATSGNACQASDSASSTNVILNAATYYPAFADKTAISGIDTNIVQLLNYSTQDIRTFYSSSLSLFTEVTSVNFSTLFHTGKMEFMDGYGFVADRSTQRIYNTDLNTLDTWSPLGYITKQIRQDGLLGLGKLGKRIIAFSEQTAEVFGNAGSEVGSPLVSIPELQANIGLFRTPSVNGGVTTLPPGATHYYAILGGKMYFPGREGLIGAALYSFDGSRFEKVSRGPVNKIISQNILSQTMYGIYPMTFSGQEAIAMQLTHVTTASARWLMYFPSWNDYFEWTSDKFAPVNSGGRWCVGVSTTTKNKLAALELVGAQWTDAGANYQFLHQFQMPRDGNTFHKMDMCQLIGDTARSTSSISINVSFSDDDGQTFTSTRQIDMTTDEKMVTRCGSYATRLVRLDYTGAQEVRLEKFAAKVSK